MNTKPILAVTILLGVSFVARIPSTIAAEHDEHGPGDEQGEPVRYHPQPTDFSRFAISPSLYFDSALALSGGVAVLVKLSGGCAHVCSGMLALAEGEIGLFGYQARLGGALSVIGEEFIRHVWFNFTGVALAAAYLSRTKDFDHTLDQRENYMGLTLSGAGVVVLRFGVFNRLRSDGRLLTFALGVGF